MKNKIFLVKIFILLLVYSVSAMPKDPSLLKEEQKLFLSRRSSQLNKNRNLNRPLKLNKQSVSGTKKYLVILIKALDKPATYDSTDFEKLLFSNGTFSSGSLRDYFAEVSNNKFNVEGSVFGFYPAKKDYSYYTDGNSGLGVYPHNAVSLVEEAIDAAEAAGVDFSKFDNDGDGEVDGIFVVHQGAGAEAVPKADEGNYIWSHKWDITSGGGTARTYDGVRINEYIMQPETNAKGIMIEIGVFCHEFGHLLGLPDLYDTDYSSSGDGVFDLMSSGAWGGDGKHPETPTQLSAWSKYYLQWANVYDYTKINGVKNLSQVEGSNDIVKIEVYGSSKEYFLLCNRQKSGFDKYLPGSGLLIWHVDENRINSNWLSGKLNDDESAQSISLMQADGELNLQKNENNGGNQGDGGDFYPGTTGNTAFTAASNPSSNKNNGEKSGAAIVNISSASLVSFTAGTVGPLITGLGETFCYPNPFKLNASTKEIIIKYPNDLPITLKIYNIAGEIVRTLDEAGTELITSRGEAFWDGKNDDGVLVGTGLYIYLIDSPQGNFKGKILFIK
ncbi:MAG: M6 family metalloprotease domain-containing protein [bacterium]|nr:M6 family metalloprotease domain-containing protein [bacterium]